jgi:protein required for attachment to host cells
MTGQQEEEATLPQSAPTTWILIADAGHAKVLQTIGVGNKLLPVTGFEFSQDIPAGKDITRERAARTHESMGQRRHAIEPKSDPRQAMKRAFAQEIAQRLDAAAAADAFDRLVVAAPPHLLGDLRQRFSAQVKKRIVAEIAQDLVKLPTAELRRHLASEVAI